MEAEDWESDWIEFEVAVSGNSIPIPEIYRKRLQGNMHITAIPVMKPEQRQKASFDAFRIDTKGFKFNREECYEERLIRFFKDEKGEEAG